MKNGDEVFVFSFDHLISHAHIMGVRPPPGHTVVLIHFLSSLVYVYVVVHVVIVVVIVVINHIIVNLLVVVVIFVINDNLLFSLPRIFNLLLLFFFQKLLSIYSTHFHLPFSPSHS